VWAEGATRRGAAHRGRKRMHRLAGWQPGRPTLQGQSYYYCYYYHKGHLFEEQLCNHELVVRLVVAGEERTTQIGH
jgi:hypothetical protein